MIQYFKNLLLTIIAFVQAREKDITEWIKRNTLLVMAGTAAMLLLVGLLGRTEAGAKLVTALLITIVAFTLSIALSQFAILTFTKIKFIKEGKSREIVEIFKSVLFFVGLFGSLTFWILWR